VYHGILPGSLAGADELGDAVDAACACTLTHCILLYCSWVEESVGSGRPAPVAALLRQILGSPADVQPHFSVMKPMEVSKFNIGHADLPGIGIRNINPCYVAITWSDTRIDHRAYVAAGPIHLKKLVDYLVRT